MIPDPQTEAANAAVVFLKLLRPNGPWVLSAIVPDGAIETTTAKTPDDIRRFVRAHNGQRNIYYSVNPTRTGMTKKAAKLDIASIEYLLADLDPADAETPEAAKARYLAGLDALTPAPTGIIDSGNGIQVLLKLAEPIVLAEPESTTDKEGKEIKVYPEATAKQIADIEARVKLLMETLGSVAGTQNIDRILRVPGTVNLPNKKKREAGRTECQTKLIKFNGATCKLEDFPAPPEPPPADEANNASPNDARSSGDTNTSGAKKSGANASNIDWAKVGEYAGWLKGVGDLPDNFSARGKAIVAHTGNLADLNFDVERAGSLTKPYRSWSEVSFAFAAVLKNDGRFSNEKIAAALLSDHIECNQHITKLKTENERRRAVERAILRSHDAPEQKKMRAAAGEPNWRERNGDGGPIPSMHNARLAITAIGVECSYDTFHDKLLIGYRDESVRHTVAQFIGEISDNGIIGLRRLLSDRFGFDLTERHIRDAVVSLALQHMFDPVADMLDEAEANWDGEARLDRMAVDYFNCEDTLLNRACVRKTMIAAVARVRDPGCKFDTITVLESKEGKNKSTAWRILASDENYSDENIIGKDSREVQEQLSGTWIHENADLAGLRNSEVEAVKAFASRQVDRARPAYGRFVRKQPRHSIEVGTTNGDQYLHSQTGNRRFWPMKVIDTIDLIKLRRDRLQLWGEAAHYQRHGEILTIDETLWFAAGIEQEKRRVKDPWEATLASMPIRVEAQRWDAIEKKYVADEHRIIHVFNGKQDRVATADLLLHVLKVPVAQQTKQHTMRLSETMKALGWQRNPNGKVSIDGKQVYGYFRWSAGDVRHGTAKPDAQPADEMKVSG
jgi:predicted P-loop ATPase